ncbi:MAG: ATP-dependent helicase, partial [Bacteroidota bacterium]
YKIYGSLSFYQRKEIKDIIAYFRLITNNKDDEAFKRVINYPARGIGKVTLDKIEQLGNEQNISLWEASAKFKEFKKVQQFHELIQFFSGKEHLTNAYELSKEVIEKTGILNDLSPEKNPENLSKSENVQELLNSIQDFSEHHEEQDDLVTISRYLENVSLLIHEDMKDEPDQERVSLMTIHAAKGLEFDNIFIVGLEEELFPSKRSAFSVKDLEEERRLFYVALTRAKENIIISYTNERYKWGEHIRCKPSRFLYEIDNQYINLPELTGADDIVQPVRNEKPNGDKPLYTENPVRAMHKKLKNIKDIRHEDKEHQTQTATGTLDYDAPESIQTGMLVEHIRFGKGKVINIEGDMPNKKATVFFNASGQKQLLLKFAKLKIVEQ